MQTTTKNNPFESEFIDPYQLWDLPLYFLEGLIRPENRITTYELAELFTSSDDADILNNIEKDIYHYANHVSPDEPELFLNIILSGTNSSSDKLDNLRFFWENPKNGNFMELIGFNCYEFVKALYLGRAATNYSNKTPEDILSRVFTGKQSEKKLRFFKKYINCLARVAKCKPVKIAAMLAAGNYSL